MDVLKKLRVTRSHEWVIELFDYEGEWLLSMYHIGNYDL